MKTTKDIKKVIDNKFEEEWEAYGERCTKYFEEKEQSRFWRVLLKPRLLNQDKDVSKTFFLIGWKCALNYIKKQMGIK